MKTIFYILFTFYSLFFFSVGNIFAQGTSVTPTAPPPLTPPHPYPSPDDYANFPKPGNVPRYYLGGQLVEDITDTVKYFRSDSFNVRISQIIQDLDQNPYPGTASATYFNEIKSQALSALNELKSRLIERRDRVLNEASLNDGIGREIEVQNTSIDQGIKNEITAFFNQVIARVDQAIVQAQAVTNSAALRNVLQSLKDYWQSSSVQTQFRTLGSKVFGQRLRLFTYYWQLIVDFNNCITPQMDAAFNPYNNNAFLYRRYVYENLQTRFNRAWYSQVQFDPNEAGGWYDWTRFWYRYMDTPPDVPMDSRDPAYGRWYITYGAKKEYLAAADVAGLFPNSEFGFTGTECIGAPSANCLDNIHLHMRAGKRQLQDMAHIFWWEYDYMTQMQEQGVIFVPNFNLCPIPQVPFLNRSGGSVPIPTYSSTPTSISTPTQRPTRPPRGVR